MYDYACLQGGRLLSRRLLLAVVSAILTPGCRRSLRLRHRRPRVGRIAPWRHLRRRRSPVQPLLLLLCRAHEAVDLASCRHEAAVVTALVVLLGLQSQRSDGVAAAALERLLGSCRSCVGRRVAAALCVRAVGGRGVGAGEAASCRAQTPRKALGKVGRRRRGRDGSFPAVVGGVVAVRGRVGERLHQAVGELAAEAVGSRSTGMALGEVARDHHQVALTLAPFGTPVLEPDLKMVVQSERSDVIVTCALKVSVQCFTLQAAAKVNASKWIRTVSSRLSFSFSEKCHVYI